MQTQALEAAMNVKPVRAGDTLTFAWARRQLGPYKTIRDGRDTVVTWDLSTALVVVAAGDRVRAIRVGHVTSY
jgi:hypothetical protein